MRCPFCNFHDSQVVDSRCTGERRVVRRRRKCVNCGRRFKTREYWEEIPLSIVKSDGRREPFDREKLRAGIRLACIKRPIPTETIDEIVDRTEAEVRESGSGEVQAKEVGEIVVRNLKSVDEVAYVRFASVYRSFQTKEEFLSELKELSGD